MSRINEVGDPTPDPETVQRETRLAHLWRCIRRWMAHPWLRRGLTIALTLVAIFSFAALLYANWPTLRAFDWQIRPVPLLFSFLAYSLALALAILAWGKIMTAVGARIPWGEHIRVYCITNLARRLPGILWFVVGRVILYDQEKASKTAISVASALELVLMGLSCLMIGILAWPSMVREHLDPAWIVVGVVLSLVVVHPRVLRLPLHWLGDKSVHDAQTELHYGRVLSWLFLYGCVWLAGGLVLFFLIETLYPLPIERLPQVIGAWSLSGLVAVLAAVLPVGLGLRELALSLLLANILPEGIAVVVAILTRLLLTLYELIWVLLVHRKWAAIAPLIRK
jgi:uncharacterized membrane protein YbhN (UPF0104 family)